MNNHRILLVDDDQNILDSFRRQLRKNYNLETAVSGIEGLKLIASDRFYSVVISDYHMPGIDGISFLKAVKLKSPSTIRIILTGRADLEIAMNAVNEGHIFRFMTKPCPAEILVNAIESGLTYQNLVVAEKDLLEKTLSGGIKVMTEILSIVNPKTFSRSIRIKNYVNHIVEKLNIPFAWQFEISALLCFIGAVTIPPQTLDKLTSGGVLTDEEKDMVAKHPQVGRDLLAQIPRLEKVADIIALQGQPYSGTPVTGQYLEEDMVNLGGNLLMIAIEFDRRLMYGEKKEQALREMYRQSDRYYNLAVQALHGFNLTPFKEIEKSVMVRELKTNMSLGEDVRTVTGALIAVKGQDITATMLQRLRAFCKSVGIEEPIRIIERR